MGSTGYGTHAYRKTKVGDTIPNEEFMLWYDPDDLALVGRPGWRVSLVEEEGGKPPSYPYHYLASNLGESDICAISNTEWAEASSCGWMPRPEIVARPSVRAPTHS